MHLISNLDYKTVITKTEEIYMKYLNLLREVDSVASYGKLLNNEIAVYINECCKAEVCANGVL